MEDYTYHLGDPIPAVLGAHMLEVCPSIAAGRPSCEIHPLSIGGRADPVRLIFDAAPGPGLIVGLADIGDRFRLVSSAVDLVEPDAPLPRLPVARAVWRPRPDLRTAAEAWLTAGGPHHTALTTSLPAEAVDDFAEIAGIEHAAIDATTTPATFRRELRWNAAFYFLERGP
jgi:L-arabinose isomerase